MDEHGSQHDRNLENNDPNSEEVQTNQDCDDSSVISKELVTNTFDFTNADPGQSISMSIPNQNVRANPICKQPTSIPLLIFSRPTSVVMRNTITQRSLNNTPASRQSMKSIPNQPQSLFLLTLAKLNESSISLAIANNRQLSDLLNTSRLINSAPSLPEPSPPDSLTSAPPSYSFVLRQMNTRRRPRLMGTFIPSPSFITHPPPPNYAAAFDIYVDNALPPPTTRVYHFGFTPMPVICTECGHTGMTMVRTKVTLCTHLCAFLLCLFCCWICAPLPYVLRSCKDVYHYCRNCRNYLGMYCPTNPDNSYA